MRPIITAIVAMAALGCAQFAHAEQFTPHAGLGWGGRPYYQAAEQRRKFVKREKWSKHRYELSHKRKHFRHSAVRSGYFHRPNWTRR